MSRLYCRNASVSNDMASSPVAVAAVVPSSPTSPLAALVVVVVVLGSSRCRGVTSDDARERPRWWPFGVDAAPPALWTPPR